MRGLPSSVVIAFASCPVLVCLTALEHAVYRRRCSAISERQTVGGRGQEYIETGCCFRDDQALQALTGSSLLQQQDALL
jgi:hypothetical protein